MQSLTFLWVLFWVVCITAVAVDWYAVTHRRTPIDVKSALRWTALWIVLALGFGVAIWSLHPGGHRIATLYLAGYLTEKSLSVDNLFVFILIFSLMRVPPEAQPRLIKLGIYLSIALRIGFILVGVTLLHAFHWLIYPLGALLVWTAWKMLGTQEQKQVRAEQVATLAPASMVMFAIGGVDVLFAIDSIPAVMGITQDPFVVITSNVFAVLGLNALFFAIRGVMDLFKSLKHGVSVILFFIGAKMLLPAVGEVLQAFGADDVGDALVRSEDFFNTHTWVSLAVIGLILLVSIAVSTSRGKPTPVAGSGVSPEPVFGETPNTRTRNTVGETPTAARETHALLGTMLPRINRPPSPMDAPAIELKQVTKFYGRRPGVLDLSMTVPRGALVGLLGPNGSGKTTTLRILSGCIPPTSGSARVCGFDVFSQSLEVRQRLGYLPENCPLYPEMYVLEYLRWTAAMKGLAGSDVDQAVFGVMSQCGVEHVRRQKIGTLSKGYRQRVGLASVLVHRPEILILDEPTVGLDPLQVREFRTFIASLKGRHTVLISSHILSEIETVCDSVIILNEGWAIASGAPDALRQNVANTYTVVCRNHASLPLLLPRLVDRFVGYSLEHYEEIGDLARFRLRGLGPDPRLEIFAMLAEAGLAAQELTCERLSLEDVFVQYVKRATEKPPAPVPAHSR